MGFPTQTWTFTRVWADHLRRRPSASILYGHGSWWWWPPHHQLVGEDEDHVPIGGGARGGCQSTATPSKEASVETGGGAVPRAPCSLARCPKGKASAAAGHARIGAGRTSAIPIAEIARSLGRRRRRRLRVTLCPHPPTPKAQRDSVATTPARMDGMASATHTSTSPIPFKSNAPWLLAVRPCACDLRRICCWTNRFLSSGIRA